MDELPPEVSRACSPYLSSERSHPSPSFLDERSWSDDAHALTGTEVSDVVCDENAGSRADRCGEDRDILRVGKLASPFAIAM
jgi:hypothetical protein